MFNQAPGGVGNNHSYLDFSAVDRELARHSIEKPYQLDQTRAHDKGYVLSQVRQNGLLLSQAPFHLRNDPEVVQAAVLENGYAIQYASLEMRENPLLVEAAIKENGWLIGYAAPQLHSNKDLFMKAVSQNGYACNFLNPELRQDLDIAKVVAHQLGYLPKAIFSEAVRTHPEIAPMLFDPSEIIKPPI